MKEKEILKRVGTDSGSECQGSACGIGNDDLLLHLLYLDYPFPAASIYFNYDQYGSTAFTSISQCHAPQ